MSLVGKKFIYEGPSPSLNDKQVTIMCEPAFQHTTEDFFVVVQTDNGGRLRSVDISYLEAIEGKI